MARRPAARPRRPIVEEAPDTTPKIGIMPLVSPAPTSAQAGGPDGPETTGRYLVLMEPDSLTAGVSALEKQASLRVAYSADFLKDPAAALSISDSEAVVFEDLGVAVVSALPDQAAAMSSVVAQVDALRTVEPERVVYALGNGSVDLAYLRGYRDAVNHLVDTLLEGGTRDGGAAAADFNDAAFTWGLQALGVDRSRLTGRGIKIAVLDTGLDFNHPDFVGRSIQSRSFIDGVPTAQDGNGHGTHCIGVAAGPSRPGQPPRFGVAPEAEIFVGKVLNDAGRGADGSILAGLQWAIVNGCEVISLSLGGRVLPGQAHSAVFEQAAQRALQRGSLILAAAGNDSRRPQSIAPVSHPANCPSIFAVGAVDSALAVAWFSNGSVNVGGGSVDIVGPGVDCRSTWTMPTQYKNESGTSMATPHVAGIAALIAQSNPAARGTSLHFHLVQTARRLSGSAADVGAGIAQAPA